MNSYFRPALALVFFFLATALPACGTKEKSQAGSAATAPETRVVQVTGRLELVGNEPLTELVISGQDGVWYVAREEQHKLRDLQHRGATVTVEGTETRISAKTSDGIHTTIFPTLSSITIIAIE
jgi:hypothetical protein